MDIPLIVLLTFISGFAMGVLFVRCIIAAVVRGSLPFKFCYYCQYGATLIEERNKRKALRKAGKK